MEIDAFVELGIIGAGCMLDSAMRVAGASWGRGVLIISKLAGIPLDIVALYGAMNASTHGRGDLYRSLLTAVIIIYLILDRALLLILYHKYGLCKPSKTHKQEFTAYLDHFIKQKFDSGNNPKASLVEKYKYGQKTLHIGAMFSSLDYFGAIYRIHTVTGGFHKLYKIIFCSLCVLNIFIIVIYGMLSQHPDLNTTLNDVCITMLFNLTNTIGLTQHFVNLSAYSLKKNYTSVDITKDCEVGTKSVQMTETPTMEDNTDQNSGKTTTMKDNTAEVSEKKSHSHTCIKSIAFTYFLIALVCINIFGWIGCVFGNCAGYQEEWNYDSGYSYGDTNYTYTGYNYTYSYTYSYNY